VPLAQGARLGVHEILGQLGAGGMGEVYLALDTRLNRKVAIKVLPEAHATDPERIARFHREAQAVAALNHSGIAAIYDLAEADSTRFLVLELIEGETLADRLRRGPVPVEEALAIARQILEALEAAHERGVCHRDLKPANIKLTPDGSVKVLDFGLAKFLQHFPSAPNLTHSPTLSLAGTYPGVILGTAGYMSPEQAKGFEADQRSDLFSFGCVLYELLSGRQAFAGETASEVLASVLKSDADWSALPPRLNPRLVELLRRCLEKNPKSRWHAAADVRVEIESLIGRGLVDAAAPASFAMARPLWKRALSATLFALAGGAIAAYAAWTFKPAPPAPITRFAISIPEGETLTALGRQAIDVSPDGRRLVYVATNRLVLRELSGLETRVIHEALGLVNPAFSPDGRSIVYQTAGDRALKRIEIGGGAPVSIATAELLVNGMRWHEDAIVFGQSGKGIFSVSPSGGAPRVIAAVAADEVVDSPQLLPGGRQVLFSVRNFKQTWDQAQVVVQPIDGGVRRTVVNGGSDGRYLTSGHLAYVVSGVVLGAPFDLRTLTVTGAAVPLIEGVRRGANSMTSSAPGNAFFAVSETGALIYVPGPAKVGDTTATDLAIFDRNGTAEPLNLPAGPYRAPRVTRDGRWVAFENIDEPNTFVSVAEIGGRSVPRRLTFKGNSRAPLWSADGAWILFSWDVEGEFALYRVRADGSGTPERLTTPEKGVAHSPQTWSADGRQLVFSIERGASIDMSRLAVLSMEDRKITPLAIESAARDAVISRDGKWIAYGTRASAGGSGNEVFVESFPPTGAKHLLPQPSAGHPLWSPQGDELMTNGTPVMSHITPVTTTPVFAFGRAVNFPRRGRAEASPAIARRQIDMMPDGRIIGIVSPTGAPTIGNMQIVVVLNWQEELKQRVPTR
jgi:serine/threonine-protein kinase